MRIRESSRGIPCKSICSTEKYNERNKDEIDLEMQYLSNKTFGCIKGWCALGILIHHVYQFSGILAGTSAGFLFINLGYWAVGLFIFMSGFGLYESYRMKGTKYIRDFPRNRILTFGITYVLVAIAYMIVDYMLGIRNTPLLYLMTFTYGSTVISFGWYLQLNMVMYLFFWVVFRFIHGKKARSAGMGILLVLFVELNIKMGINYARYAPIFFFVLGIMWSIHKERVEKILSKVWFLCLAVSFILFFGGYLILWRYELDLVYVILIYVVSQTGLIVFVMNLIRLLFNLEERFQTKAIGKVFPGIVLNRFSSFWGRYSLEIYVCQGMVLRILYICIENKYLFAVSSITVVVAVSIPLHRILNAINNRIKKV